MKTTITDVVFLHKGTERKVRLSSLITKSEMIRFELRGIIGIPYIKIADTYSEKSVEMFCKCINGEPIEVNKEICIDLFCLGSLWRIDKLYNDSLVSIKLSYGIRNLINQIPVFLERGIALTEIERHISKYVRYNDLTSSFFNLPMCVVWRILMPRLYAFPTADIVDFIVFMITNHPYSINLFFPYVILTDLRKDDLIKLSVISKPGTALENFILYIKKNQASTHVEMDKIIADGRAMCVAMHKTLAKKPGELEYQLSLEYRRGTFIEPDEEMHKRLLAAAVKAKHVEATFMYALEREEEKDYKNALQILTKLYSTYSETLPHLRKEGRSLLKSGDPELEAVGIAYVNVGIKNKDAHSVYIYGKHILRKWGNDMNKGYQFLQSAAKMDFPKAKNYLKKIDDEGGLANLQSMINAANESFKKAERGDTMEMMNYAVMRNMGIGVPKDVNIAAQYLEKAARKSCSTGMNLYGSLLLLGYGVEKDEKAAFDYFKRSSKMEDPDGMVLYAWALETGRGTKRNKDEALRIYEKASQKDNVDALLRIGLYKLNNTNDEKTAMSYIQKAAEQENPNAIFCLGWLYENGKCVKKDVKEALRYYKSASVFGSDFGHLALGRAYENGIIVEKNVNEARKLYKQAYKAVNAENIFINGMCFEKGETTPKDLGMAALCYRVCAEFGDPKGMFHYGRMISNGLGVERSEVEGMRWIDRARQNGYYE